MTVHGVESYVCGAWVAPGADARPLRDAATGEVFAQAGHDGLDLAAMRDYARSRGGPALRALDFHDRARMLKALATHLNTRREALYTLSFRSGATRADSQIDIDGGIGTLFVYASKGRRELPAGRVMPDGGPERLSRDGGFLGQHLRVPRQGVAVQINAFNFPVWGMLEKLAPCLLAGMPAIVKPATATSPIAEACLRCVVESGILPDGALQMVAGDAGGLLDLLDAQDVVSFTGSAETALHLRSNPALLRRSVPFIAEQDSLNATILGPDAEPGTPEFDLLVAEVAQEMTVKAGQKCTAIRRIVVPQAHLEAVARAVSLRLEAVVQGDPRRQEVTMGPLVSLSQRRAVLGAVAALAPETERLFGDAEALTLAGGDPEQGAFVPPILLGCADPDAARRVHETEAFGPVATLMGYRDLDHALALVNRGGGSLVASLFTRDGAVAREAVLGAGAWHGRLYVANRDSASGATGHGAPVPHMLHGGPGRAGGGEELGGLRGLSHYMQRLAVQGSPDILTAVTGAWVDGAVVSTPEAHPFTRRFGTLTPGETLVSAERVVTLEDIEHFAAFTGDRFYAHLDEAAAQRNPFFSGRVAHGYLLLSFAAGLFVEPSEGPVLANTGLDDLRFLKPVSPGTRIHARLTVKAKTPRTDEYGEVRWRVRLLDAAADIVAEYDLLTMVAK